ncbi:MAG TPA: hypothetical protein VHT28_19145, partial [Silvibacterium sp.]|nr:hypothetical protein [Silvibacterium sp.]
MPVSPSTLHYRLATPADIPRLHVLIDRSVRELQAQDYTPTQIDQALQTYLSLDTQLIVDQTYFVVEAPGSDLAAPLVASGGWSKRKTLAAATPAWTDATTAQDGTAACSILRERRLRSAPFMCILTGRAVESER